MPYRPYNFVQTVKYIPIFLPITYTVKNALPVTMLMKTGLNNTLLPILFLVVPYCSGLFSTTLLQARRFLQCSGGGGSEYVSDLIQRIADLSKSLAQIVNFAVPGL
jgi:hypothetical protein